MSDAPAPNKPVWRRVGLVVLGVVGLVVAFVVLAFATRPAVPPAPFSESDIPALPDASDNAWSVLIGAGLRPAQDPPGAGLLSHRTGPPAVTALWGDADTFNEYRASPALERAIEQAMRRPHMVADCPANILVPCPQLEWRDVHGAIVAQALHLLVAGEHVAAITLTQWLVRADHDSLTHARSLISLALAQVTLRESVELAALVGAALGAAPEDLEVGSGDALESLELAVASMEPASWTLENAVTGEAIAMRRALDDPTIGGTSQYADFGRLAIWLDARALQMRAYARDPAHVDPPQLEAPGLFWRMTDPYAAANTVALSVDIEPRQRSLDDFTAALIERVEVARVSIRAGRARAAIVRAAQADSTSADPAIEPAAGDISPEP